MDEFRSFDVGEKAWAIYHHLGFEKFRIRKVIIAQINYTEELEIYDYVDSMDNPSYGMDSLFHDPHEARRECAKRNGGIV